MFRYAQGVVWQVDITIFVGTSLFAVLEQFWRPLVMEKQSKFWSSVASILRVTGTAVDYSSVYESSSELSNEPAHVGWIFGELEMEARRGTQFFLQPSLYIQHRQRVGMVLRAMICSTWHLSSDTFLCSCYETASDPQRVNPSTARGTIFCCSLHLINICDYFPSHVSFWSIGMHNKFPRKIGDVQHVDWH